MKNKKVVLITGGSDGLGKIIAQRLAGNHRVVILSPTQNKLQEVAKKLGCEYVVADVSDFSALEKAVEKVINNHSRIDCLVNCAGLWIQGELEHNDHQKIDAVLRVNTIGTIFATKAVTTQMKKQRAGLIVNINSLSGVLTKEERAVYVASKFAVTGFTRSIQSELSKYGICVTGILPGGLKTTMFDKAGNPKDQTDFLDPDEVAKVVEFLLTINAPTVLPEIWIKNLNN